MTIQPYNRLMSWIPRQSSRPTRPTRKSRTTRLEGVIARALRRHGPTLALNDVRRACESRDRAEVPAALDRLAANDVIRIEQSHNGTRIHLIR